jgi:hypothetical protein
VVLNISFFRIADVAAIEIDTISKAKEMNLNMIITDDSSADKYQSN